MRTALAITREFISEGIAENLAALLTVQFFRKLLPLITIPYLARVLGPEGWGLLAVFQSAAMCAVLVIEFGFQLSATRQLARCRQYPEKVAEIFAGVIGAQTILVFAAIVGVGVVSAYIPMMRSHPVMVASCLIWAAAEGITPGWYFLGIEWMRPVATLEIACKSLVAVGMFAFVRSPGDAATMLAMQAGASVSSLVICLWLIRSSVPWRLPTWAQIREAVSAGWPMFVLRSAESFYTVANAFLLGLFAGPVTVSYFAGPEKISRSLIAFFNPLRDALYPRISKLVHTAPPEAARLARIGTLVTVGGGLVMGVLVYLLAPQLIHILLGAGFEPAITVLRLLAFLPPMVAVTQSIGMQWLIPLGREKAVTRTMVIAGIVNVTLMFLFVPSHAHIGMSWAVLSAEGFVCSSVLYFAVRGQGIQRRSPEILSYDISQVAPAAIPDKVTPLP